MRLRRSRKIWRVHERHDFEATSQFQAAEREQTEPTKPHRCAEPGFYRRYSAREIRSSRYKKGSRPASAHAQCQEHGQLRAFPPGVSSRWKGDRISQVRAELARLFDEQVVLRRRAQQQPSRTARISRKTGSHTAVIWGTTRIARSGRGRSSMESADSALRQNDAIVRS